MILIFKVLLSKKKEGQNYSWIYVNEEKVAMLTPL